VVPPIFTDHACAAAGHPPAPPTSDGPAWPAEDRFNRGLFSRTGLAARGVSAPSPRYVTTFQRCAGHRPSVKVNTILGGGQFNLSDHPYEPGIQHRPVQRPVWRPLERGPTREAKRTPRPGPGPCRPQNAKHRLHHRDKPADAAHALRLFGAAVDDRRGNICVGSVIARRQPPRMWHLACATDGPATVTRHTVSRGGRRPATE